MNARTVWFLGLPASVLLIALSLIGGLGFGRVGQEASAAVTTLNANCNSAHNIVVDRDGQVIENMILLNADQSAIEVGSFDNVTVRNVRAEGFNCSGAEHEAYAGVSCDGCANLTVTDSHFQTTYNSGGGGVHFEDSGGGHLVARNTIIGGKDGIGTYPEDDPSGAFTSGVI